MAVQIIKTTFQLKRGTAARWKELNPVLRQGEPGFEFDTGKLKIGDGLTTYNDLRYQTSKDYIVRLIRDSDFLTAEIIHIYNGVKLYFDECNK